MVGLAELVVIVPVLRRPHRVKPLLRSLAKATRTPYEVLFVTDPTDEAEHVAIDEAQAEYHAAVLAVDGNYARKINVAVDATTNPLIFTGADDLDFHHGWLEAAKDELKPGIGVVGTVDLCNARTIQGTHSTHSLVTRSYTERGTADDPTKLLHEGYLHEFVDDEFVQTAQARDAYAHAGGSIVEHLHPQVGKAPLDDLYRAQRSRMRQGRRVYRARRHLWT